MKTNSILSRIASLIQNHPTIAALGIILGIVCVALILHIRQPLYASEGVIENAGSKGTNAFNFLGACVSPMTEKVTSKEFITSAIENNVKPVTNYITQDFSKRTTAYSFPYDISYTVNTNTFSTQEYIIRENGAESYSLVSNVHGLSREKTAKFGEELVDQNLTLVINKKKRTPYLAEPILGETVFSFKIQSPENLAQELSSGKLTANDQNGVLTITCLHENAQLAKDVATAITTTLTGVTSTTENIKTKPFETQLSELSQQMEAGEDELALYKQQNNISDQTTETARILGVITQLEMQKTQLELEKAALDNTSRYMRKYRSENNSNVDYGVVSDPSFSGQMDVLNQKYEAKANGTASATIDAEIEALKVQVSERIRNTRKKNAIKLHKINQQLDIQNAALASLPSKYQALNNLDRKLALDRKMFDVLAEKRAQILLTGTTDSGVLKLIRPATISYKPHGPATWVMILCGMLCGLILSLPFASWAENRKQQRIQNRETLDQQSKIPFIGTISFNSITQREIDASISNLCTAVLLKPNVKQITFTASESGTGTDFISLRFAQALAAMDKKVLIMDMDHGSDPVSGLLETNPEHTLSDVLKGTCDVHDAVCITTYPNLDLLQGGEFQDGINSLLASKNRSKIFEDLKKHYDIIVTNTPDIGTQIDAIPMMKLGDLSLFVVRANTTRKKSLVIAEQIKRDYEIENLCFLLNTIKPKSGAKGNSPRTTKVKNISTDGTTFVPQMLKKIALWFY